MIPESGGKLYIKVPIEVKVALVLLMITLLFSTLRSQNAALLYEGRYSGIHGVIANPAWSTASVLAWDVNIASSHAFLHQNYAFFRSASLIHVLRNQSTIEVVEIYADETFADGDVILDFEASNRSKSASLLMDVIGPSLTFKINDWAFAAFGRMRMEAGIPSVDAHLGYYQFHGIPFGEITEIQPFQGAAMLWAEVGIGASRFFLDDQSLHVGATLKYLIGYEGMYGQVNPSFAFVRQNNDELRLIRAEAELALTSGFYDHNDFNIGQKGKGAGLDFGVVKRLDNLTLSISLLDLGMVSFGDNAQMHRTSIADSLVLFIPGFTAQRTLGGLIAETNATTGTSSLEANSFSIVLPAKLRIYADKHLAGDWHIGATFVTPFIRTRHTIIHKPFVAITPRYERRWFTLNFPVVWDHFRSLRFGLGLRLGLLSIGTEDVCSLFGKSSLNGTSFFAAIKINPFGIGGRHTMGSKGVECPVIDP